MNVEMKSSYLNLILSASLLLFSVYVSQAIASWSKAPVFKINGSFNLVSDLAGQAIYAVPVSLSIDKGTNSSYNGCTNDDIKPFFAVNNATTSTTGLAYNAMRYDLSVDNISLNGMTSWVDEKDSSHSDGIISLSADMTGDKEIQTSDKVLNATHAYYHPCIMGPNDTTGYLVLKIQHDYNQPLMKSFPPVNIHLWGQSVGAGSSISSLDDFGLITINPDVNRASTSCTVNTDDLYTNIDLSSKKLNNEGIIGTTTINCNRNSSINITAEIKGVTDELSPFTLQLGFMDSTTGEYMTVNNTDPVSISSLGVPLQWKIKVTTSVDSPPAPKKYDAITTITFTYD